MKKRKDNKKMQNGMMWFITFIMITSVMGYMWKGGPEKVKYGEGTFVADVDGWAAFFNKQRIVFDYFPTELESLEFDPIANQRLSGIEVDTTYDLNDSFVEEIAKAQFSMEQQLLPLDIFVVKGFTTENEYNMPVVTCSDATQFVPVIYFKRSNQTAVRMDGNCIVAEAFLQSDIVRLKDRIMYSILGVMK